MKSLLNDIKYVWENISKIVLWSTLIVLGMTGLFVFSLLSTTGAVVLGSTAIVFAVLSLRES
jgi:hypothetical protein